MDSLDRFQTEDFLRYRAECARMAGLASVVRATPKAFGQIQMATTAMATTGRSLADWIKPAFEIPQRGRPSSGWA